MGKYVDITGHKYGRLTALRDVGKDVRNGRVWKCLCECGEQVDVSSNHLRRGHTKSCGCYQIERVLSTHTTHGHANVGKVSTEYKIWAGMKGRCQNPKSPNYDLYGGRGIKVCEEWSNSFENFLADMGKRPSPQYSLDRIDTNGNYEPGNCRWATRTMQNRNQNIRKDNTSGVRGVRWTEHKERWTALIGVNRGIVILGHFETKEEAKKAREQAEIKYWNKQPS